jgi:hypothetical protein
VNVLTSNHNQIETMARNNRKRTRQSRQAQPVYTVDAQDSPDQLRVSRTFAAMDASLSLINTVIEANTFLNVGTTTANQGATSFGAFTSTTDFSAFATEYKLFRIKAIQFDVYDVNPNSTGTAYFSTQHINAGTTLGTGLSQVTSAIDVGIVPPGVGMKTFTWVAKTNDELSYQASSGTIQDYGGLVYYSPTSTGTGSSRWTIIAKAHIQFRSRV